MSLDLQRKQEIIAEVNKVVKNALSIVVADFCGINVEEINRLRKESRKIGVYMKVVRNNLLRRAVVDTNFECLKHMFIGPTLIACSMEHPGTAARLLKEFSKTNTNFQIKVASFEGKIIQASQIDHLATLPTYKEAIIRLIVIIKDASVGKLVRTLSTICRAKKTS